MTRTFTLILMMLLTLGQTHAAPSVSTSIKPVHSLVSSVMKGVGEPTLLITGSEDPHHVSLKPSQRRAIADSDLIVWIGDSFETSISKAVGQSRGLSLQLLKTKPPRTYTARLFNDQDNEQIDPHIWLSPDNAIHIVRQVTDALVMLDSKNRAAYEKNRDRTISRIDSLAAELEFELAINSKVFIAHHDAYQYFEKSFGLEQAGALRDNSHTKASASQISKLKHMVELRTANCIVYTNDDKPAILSTLGKTENTRHVRVPALGVEFNASGDLWFDLIKKVTRRFRECLQ